MTLYWWTCPWCFDRMATHPDESRVELDRDRHIADKHPTVVIAGARFIAISHYRFTEVHA